MATVRADVLPWFLTLTYPADWPLEWSAWKSHLHRFTEHHLTRRGRERLPIGGIWKLEPQKRGAPHFHAIVYGSNEYDVSALAEKWSRTIGTNDLHHKKYGLNFAPARSIRGVMAYAGKRYMGKTVAVPEGWEHVGRYWGVFGRQYVPVSKSVSCTLTKYGWHRVRRLMRRVCQSRGFRLDARCNNFYTQAHWQWLRAFEWAEGEPVQAYDFAISCARQPF